MTRKTFLTRILAQGYKKQRLTDLGRYTPDRRWFASKNYAVGFGKTITRYGITVIDLKTQTCARLEDWGGAWALLNKEKHEKTTIHTKTTGKHSKTACKRKPR